MSQTSDYYKSVKEFLQEEYGIEDLEIIQGGKHKRGLFEYEGVPRKITLHNTVKGNAQYLNMQKSNIRRMLGRPEKQPKQEMEVTMENVVTPAMLEQQKPAVKVEPVVVAPPETKGPAPSMGQIAIYKDRIKFIFPKELRKKGGYTIHRDSQDSWTLKNVPLRKSPTMLEDGTLSTIYQGLREGLELCGPSPAEFLLVEDSILVRLLLDQIQPPGYKPTNRQTIGEFAQKVQVKAAARDRDRQVPPEEGGPGWWRLPNDAEDQIRAALAAVRAVEESTAYRIVRTREGGVAFEAPRIE